MESWDRYNRSAGASGLLMLKTVVGWRVPYRTLGSSNARCVGMRGFPAKGRVETAAGWGSTGGCLHGQGGDRKHTLLVGS